jgi:hypothetical protein
MNDLPPKSPRGFALGGATPDVFKKAKELRRYQTDAEKRLRA